MHPAKESLGVLLPPLQYGFRRPVYATESFAKLVGQDSHGIQLGLTSFHVLPKPRERDPRITRAGLLPATAKRHGNASPTWHPTFSAFLASAFARAFGAERHKPLDLNCPENERGDPCVTASEGGTPAHPDSIPSHKTQHLAGCLEQA